MRIRHHDAPEEETKQRGGVLSLQEPSGPAKLSDMLWQPDKELFESLRNRLRAAGLGNGPWDAPSPEVAEQVAAVLDAQLAREVARIIPDEMIQMASTSLAETQDARYHLRTGPQGKTIEGVRTGLQLTAQSMAARLLLEHAVRNRSVGRRRIDAITGPRLLNLADQTCRAHVVADRSRHRLSRVVSMSLSRTGRVEFVVADEPPFRMSMFEGLLAARMGSLRREEDTDPEFALQLVESLQTGAPIPNEFVQIDAGLRESRGHGLVDLLAALATLGQLAGGHDEDVVGISLARTEMVPTVVEHARHAFPHHSRGGVAAALPRLTWTQELIQETPTAIAEYRHVPARLLSRPLIERPSGSYFVARTAPDYAMYTLILRLFEGTWVEDLRGCRECSSW